MKRRGEGAGRATLSLDVVVAVAAGIVVVAVAAHKPNRRETRYNKQIHKLTRDLV